MMAWQDVGLFLVVLLHKNRDKHKKTDWPIAEVFLCVCTNPRCVLTPQCLILTRPLRLPHSDCWTLLHHSPHLLLPQTQSLAKQTQSQPASLSHIRTQKERESKRDRARGRETEREGYPLMTLVRWSSSHCHWCPVVQTGGFYHPP